VKLSLNKYERTQSIWGNTFSLFGLSNTYTTSYFFDSRVSLDQQLLPSSANGMIIVLTFEEQVTRTVAEPETIFNCMIQIGGLIGLVNFFSIFAMYH
jgi:hypothetical protein